MLDCQLFGLKAGGHHFTNVLFHTVSVVLLFLLLRQMTGAFWQSAFVAALFAVHPLHVESVAWVSERKDVLSGVFFMLTLWAYTRYVQARSMGRYLTVALFFVLGLMSKPMLVTVPCVLLLLDYWPLNRFSWDRTRLTRGARPPTEAHSVAPLFVEKIPLIRSLRSFVHRDFADTALQRRSNRPVAACMATEQRGCHLRCLYLADVLARPAGGFLSSSERSAPDLAGYFCNYISHLNQSVSNPMEERTTLYSHWLVLVCRNACAGDRVRSGWRTRTR